MGTTKRGISWNIIIENKAFYHFESLVMAIFLRKFLHLLLLEHTQNTLRSQPKKLQDCKLLARYLKMFLTWRRCSGFVVSSFTSHPTANPILVNFIHSLTFWFLIQNFLLCVIKDWNENGTGNWQVCFIGPLYLDLILSQYYCINPCNMFSLTLLLITCEDSKMPELIASPSPALRWSKTFSQVALQSTAIIFRGHSIMFWT